MVLAIRVNTGPIMRAASPALNSNCSASSILQARSSSGRNFHWLLDAGTANLYRRLHRRVALLLDLRVAAPGQEIGICADFVDDIVDELRRVRQKRAARNFRHFR